MDERIHEHAAVLVDWSMRIETGDGVVVPVDEEAHNLTVTVIDALGGHGANAVTTYTPEEVQRAYLRTHGGDFELPEHEPILHKVTDSVFFLGDTRNTATTASIPTETRQAYGRATSEVREACMDTNWASTVHPVRATTQQAGMSFEAYTNFVYGVILRDWSELTKEMASMKDVLNVGSEVRIVKADTDLTIPIEGRTTVNSATSVAYDSHNFPSGEVSTAPIGDVVEGEMFLDVPMALEGQHVENAHLTFEGGGVVSSSAGTGKDAPAGILGTDEGARRLEELGIGMNHGIDRFTDSVLFDGRMGDTVHLMVGRTYDVYLPEGKDGNQSVVHVDMIANMNEDSHIEVDGEVVQRGGTFRREDGF